MRARWSLWLIAVLLGTWIALQAFTDDAKWDRYTQAGKYALSAEKFVEAEKNFQAALDLAQKFGPDDPRFRESLENLGILYQTETRNAETGTLHPQTLKTPVKVQGS